MGDQVKEPLTVADIRRLREEQGDRCALSGRPLTPDNCVADHVVPLTRGGAHCVSNVQLLTKRVNDAKGNLTSKEFLALCTDVVVTHGL